MDLAYTELLNQVYLQTGKKNITIIIVVRHSMIVEANQYETSFNRFIIRFIDANNTYLPCVL